jgi:hypothetical protein
MTKFEDKYFSRLKFTPAQVAGNLKNALKDLAIAQKDEIADVKFNYAYSALIKAGITLLSHHQVKVKSVAGHHIKILEKLSELLSDPQINDIGNTMRSKRNLDLYGGGVEITEKECREYLEFTEKVLSRVKAILK